MKNRSKFSSSLPRNYMIPLPSSTPNPFLNNPLLNNLTQGNQLIPPRSRNQVLNLQQDDLDASHLKFDSEGYLSGESDFSNHSPSNQLEASKGKHKRRDKSTRGGNVFGLLRRNSKKESKKIIESLKRAVSSDRMTNKSIQRQQEQQQLQNGLHNRNFSDDTELSLKTKSTTDVGSLLVPRGFKVETKDNSKKKKKLVFTEVRNSVNAKDSSTAYLGEEKSVHRGKNFAPIGKNEEAEKITSNNTNKFLTPVKEEIDILESSSVVLQPIEGVDSWSETSKNLIFPALAAKCKPYIFKSFQSNTTYPTCDYKSRFENIMMGPVQISKEHHKEMKAEQLKWRNAYFELRQNYLMEYPKDLDSSSRPCGYAFLQDATITPYTQIKNALRLEYTQHQEKQTRTAVIVRLDTGKEEQRWLAHILKAAALKIEDLYEYDASVGGDELGSGRYASIRPGRRRRDPSINSSLKSISLEESSQGILKKRPSFVSFSNLKALSQDQHECALKIVDKSQFWNYVRRGSERADSIIRETCVQATLMSQACEQKGFLQLKSFFETRNNVVLELELLEGTDLYQFVKKEQPLSEQKAVEIMHDILTCIVVMKKFGIAHRDLKPANILMADKSKPGMRVNIADFGNATFVDKDGLVRGRCGTVGYVAPEILRAQKNSGYENKVDEFSAGVILYVLLCGYEPFYGETEKELIEENKKAVVDFPEEDWSSISLEGRDLVEKLMRPDPSKRIDASTALQHPWITRRLRRRRRVTQDESQDDSPKTEEFACVIS